MNLKSSALLLSAVLLSIALYSAGRTAFPLLADDLLFQRIDGQQQTFRELKGKPLLVTFWSPSCVICMHEVDALNQLYAAHRGGEAFELLGLSMPYDRPDSVIQSSHRAGMQYPVYLDLQSELSSAFGNVVATPTSYLIDARGEIVYRHAGKLDFTLLDKKLNELTG